MEACVLKETASILILELFGLTFDVIALKYTRTLFHDLDD